MEVPEKIYVDNPNHDFWYWYRTKAGNSIEYIHKEIFINKAVTYLILNTRTIHYSFGDRRELLNPNLEVVIEDFKKYMKGE